MLKGPSSHIDPTPYKRPEPLAPNTIHLDGNEGNRPPRELLRALSEAGPELLRNYPSTRELEERLADDLGVDARQVVVTAGADDALDRCCRAYLAAGKRMILPVPGFEMLHRFAANAGGSVTTVPWLEHFPTDEVIGRIDAETTLIAVVSPNNPTGAVIEPSDLERVANAARGRALVVLDQVYKQYADSDLTSGALGFDNVILVESLSKAPGLAGCRVGYAVAQPEVADVLRSAGNPYPTSGMSLAVALAQLDTGGESIDRHVVRVRTEREQLSRQLTRLGVPVPESQGNFLLPDFGSRTRFVFEALRALGVLVRWFPEREHLETSLRVTLPGDPADFARLQSSLDLCLDPQALLLDMDGVLADVRDSYHAAILATAEHYGEVLTGHDIAAAKRAGNANNDWQLTRRLLEERGVEASLDEVTDRFQTLYLGEDGADGLRAREEPLISLDVLRSWASRLPLGVVTGRPRAEAEWFLDRSGMRDLMRVVVCLEDAPAKPDPKPVRLALERLGVERAWLVGDTPDDMRAAARAGALPIGIPAPGSDRETTEQALSEAGGAAILERLEDLKEFWR
jgi:histidinol-phosphate aminotransferase